MKGEVDNISKDEVFKARKHVENGKSVDRIVFEFLREKMVDS